MQRAVYGEFVNVLSMSNTDKRTVGKAEDETWEWWKPRHVRKLNFGQSILAANVVNQFGEQRNGRLIIDRSVTRIPCMEKGEFVRKWVETHGNNDLNRTEESRLTSPILGSSATKRAERSPILGNRRKRARGKASLNNDTIKTTKRVCQNDGNAQTSISVSKRLEFTAVSGEREKETGKENISNSSYSAFNTSPVLDRNSYCSYEKRRRRENVDTNMNSVVLGNIGNTEHSRRKPEIICSERQLMLINKLKRDIETSNLESRINRDPTPLEEPIVPSSPVLQTKLNIVDSPRETKDNVRIETESSNEDWSNCNDRVYINSDSEKSLVDQIEDVDTQDAVPNLANCKSMRSLRIPSPKPASIRMETSSRDSDETFYFKAEATQLQTLPSFCSVSSPSQRISQVSSQTNNPGDNKSSLTDIIISMETSPEKSNSDPIMSLHLLDSGKKRRKPKKGSLTERLAAIIGREISFVRIWRHQVKQATKSNTVLRYVAVYVQNCRTFCGRQFLEGIVVDDPFNLLPPQKSDKLNLNRSKSEGDCRRSIIIMTIPQIVGRIEMKSESIVQISPPWKLLDEKKMILNVTYISAASDKERVNRERCRITKESSKQLSVKDFDCPCINANAMLQDCKRTSDKPDVIQHIFNNFAGS